MFFFLGVEEVRISGAAKRLGEAFLSLARRAFKKDFRVGYTRLGKDVPAALSGAEDVSPSFAAQASSPTVSRRQNRHKQKIFFIRFNFLLG